MSRTERRTRFEGRVDLERDFLTRVNLVLGGTVPLAGMTRSAIESWSVRAQDYISSDKVRRVSKILIEVSTRAELLADSSRDVFEPDRRPKPNSLDHLRDLLEEAMKA